MSIKDHNGNEVTHGRASVNGVRLHYVTAGQGEPLLLIHGVPKSSYYWHRIIPLLSKKYTVIAPDVRGFGDSFRPAGGYDMATIGKDLAELMAFLGHDNYLVHGEDWGAAFAYALTAQYPDRIKKLSYSEMLLPGFGLEKWSNLEAENVFSNHFLWHVSFFHVPDFPEMLITGRERQFWETWMKNETYDPTAITQDCIDEWTRTSSAPGGLRAIFQVYRETFKNIEDCKRWSETKLKMPVIAIGSEYFVGAESKREMELVAENVSYVEIDCGHSLALERPQKLADALDKFFSA